MFERSLIRVACAFAAALVMGGCAGIGGNHGAGIDADGMRHAIAQDDSSYVQAALRRGLNVNQRIAAPGYSTGAPIIALAAREASIQTLRVLIAAGADVNARTPVNETPLMLASYFREQDAAASADRHDEAVRILLDAGAYLENDSYNYTPLAYAAFNDRQRAMRYLIERGASIDADAYDRVTYINTPLMMASIQGHREAVRTLLRAGADPLIRVKGGNTAREFAVKYRHSHVEPLLACAEAVPPGLRYAQHCEGPNFAATR